MLFLKKHHYRQNPINPIGDMHDSVPPATITFASPYWINRMASPIECAPKKINKQMNWPLNLPVAQAVLTE